jgi:hypothetical protein
VAAAQSACWNRSTLPPYYQPPPEMRDPEPPDAEALAAEREELIGWGYEWIVLHRERCRVPARAIPLLDRLLGRGERLPDGDVAWRLAEID